MRPVSYFQRYSQRENHVTNNTLLLLRHLDRVSPRKVSALLGSLLEDDIELGLEFHLQIKGAAGVEDGYISQRPVHIFIEAKRGGKLDFDQLQRHMESIAKRKLPRESAVLIGLATEKVVGQDLVDLQQHAHSHGVNFCSVTYSQICEELRAICADYEEELRGIINDYIDYLESENLLSNPLAQLAIVPCGKSWQENAKYGIYYEPPHRRGKWGARFLGIYHEKNVSHIGIIATVAICEVQEGNPAAVSTEFGELSEEQLKSISEIVEQTKYYDLRGAHRFYLVDNFVACRFPKVSSGGMMGNRYLNLGNYVPADLLRPNASAQDLADELGKSEGWK